jgi:hypothetical protein
MALMKLPTPHAGDYCRKREVLKLVRVDHLCGIDEK